MSEAVLLSPDANIRASAGTPLWLRVLHFLMAIAFLVLVYTGVILTYSYSSFALMDYDLATTLHDIFGIGISIVYVVFMIYAGVTGYWRVYQRRWASLHERMTRPFIRIFRAQPGGQQDTTLGQRRVEASMQFLVHFQQFAYLATLVVLMPLLVGTGLVYLYPETMVDSVAGLDGLWPLALAHFVTGLLGTIFLLIHIYISTIAGFRRIILGR